MTRTEVIGDGADRFLVQGPAVVSFSGGRTSAYMLWRILQAHRGTLPEDVVVCFANTGREMPATLDFVARCAAEWAAPVVWLEFRHGYADAKAKRRTRYAEVVSHNSASRSGEPFDMLLESKKIVPDRERRFCSEQLKSLTIRRYLRSLRWSRWKNVVGFRADESVRIEDKRVFEVKRPGIPEQSAFPLADGGVQVMDVFRFWRSQPFDLQLDADGDGGNCDGCFLFSADRIGRMFKKYPERMDWWPRTEARLGTKTMRPGQSYADIRETAMRQGVLAWDDASPCRDVCGV
jgi:3'-phosphoadenosine 5'-phosphosulfate sulfotransferase (PAPS reductase)/FAD synthetase